MADTDDKARGPAGESSNPLAEKLAKDVGLSLGHEKPGSALSTPQTPDESFASPVAQTGKLGDDIANILKEVQLPERHEIRAAPKKHIENKAVLFDATPPAPADTGAPGRANATPETSDAVVPVHTLKDDLQKVVRDQKISVVRAVSLEEDRRARENRAFEAPETPPRSKKTSAALFSVVVLLFLGAGALFGVYTVMMQKNAPPRPAPGSSVLFAESSVVLQLSGQSSDDLKRLLSSTRSSSQGALGSITEIVPMVSETNPDGATQTRPATFPEFMQALGAHPPDSLVRALSGDFFFGIHTVDTNAPLFVIPVVSYDHAFAGMLAWEGTMNADLSPVFTPVPAMTTDQNGLPTSRTFQDVVMRNYDTRALKDDAGNIKLYYSFPTQSILVIAESPYSFAEVLSRLQAGKAL